MQNVMNGKMERHHKEKMKYTEKQNIIDILKYAGNGWHMKYPQVAPPAS